MVEYISKPDGSAALAHVIQIVNEQAGTWYEAFVDAHSGELLSVTDFVTKAAVSGLIVECDRLVPIILLSILSFRSPSNPSGKVSRLWLTLLTVKRHLLAGIRTGQQILRSRREKYFHISMIWDTL